MWNTYLVQDPEQGSTRGLFLIRHIGVPAGLIGTVGTPVLLKAIVAGITIDCRKLNNWVFLIEEALLTNVELRIALHISGCGVDLNRSEVSTDTTFECNEHTAMTSARTSRSQFVSLEKDP